jgi:GMP synthase-like glutamine amidotransferase
MQTPGAIMRPIAIFRHLAIEGPGYLAELLDTRNIPWVLIPVDEGAEVPVSPGAYSGLVFMGGPMSVNDDLPWISESLTLIRQAVAADIPVLGHCLGGQLMAKALGGQVTRNPVKEIGWGSVEILDNPAARHWFGDWRDFMAFHWHGETFSLPEGATRLLASAHCANQAFSLRKHLGLQCHVEMTPPMVEAWCAAGRAEIAASGSPAVATPETILAMTPFCLPAMTRVADHLYQRWLEGVSTSA